MNVLTKRLSPIGVTLAATMMFAVPSFAATNMNSQTPHVMSSNTISIPTSFWDLSTQDDREAFVGAITSGMYSKYYFNSNNGTLYVKNIKLYSESGMHIQCEVGIYSKTTGAKVRCTSFTTSASGSITVSNLESRPYRPVLHQRSFERFRPVNQRELHRVLDTLILSMAL